MIPNQTPEQFATLLGELDACTSARCWADGKSLYEAIAQCDRADWLMWLFRHMRERDGWPNLNDLILTACDCADKVLHLTPKKDRHIFKTAIESARKYLAGEITRDELKAAVKAAADAAAAYAADVAAADAAADVAAAAYAADVAAADAAYAADVAAADAAYAAAAYAADVAAAAAAADKEICDIIRRNLWTPFKEAAK